MLADWIATTSLHISRSSDIFSYKNVPNKKAQTFALLWALDGTWAQPVVSEDGSHVQSSVEASGCIH